MIIARTPLAASLALLLGAASLAAHADGPPKLTRKQLEEAQAIVIKAYPAPFKQTYDLVVAKLGRHHKGSEKENMYQWFAADGGQCVVFFMTKDAHKGHAAAGVYDGSASDCKPAAK